MRILIYIYCFPGPRGTERVTSFLANELVKHGQEVTVLSHISMEVGNTEFPLHEKVQVIHTPNKGFYSLINKRFIQVYIREAMPDVIIFQDSTAPIAHNIFFSGLKVPIIVCAHTGAYKFYESPNKEQGVWRYVSEALAFPVVSQLKYLRDRLRRRWLYNKCWRYVLLSTRLYGEFRAVARIGDSRKLRAIPNPILDGAHDLTETLEDKVNEVVFVGALNRGKGVDLLLRAWTLLCGQKKVWKLRIVGDGPGRAGLQELAEKLEVKNVEFVGWTVSPMKYFRVAKILAFPSRGEGWGLVVTEAMSAGCVPVVMDSYSSAREIIDDGDNGYVVPAFDVKLFADKLLLLMSDDSVYLKMSRNAIKKTLKYAPEAVFHQWQKLFSELNEVEG